MNRLALRTIRFASAILLFTLPAFRMMGQETKVVVLENADDLIGRIIDGQEVRELIGNVRMVQENVRMSCDSALQFVLSGKIVLSGNVVVREDSVTLYAPRANYYRDERRAEGFGGVRLDDGRTVLTAEEGEYFVEERTAYFRDRVTVRDSVSTVTGDSLTYFRDDQRSVVTGHVIVRHHPDRTVISGGHLVHDAPLGYSLMTRDPMLIQIDSSAASIDTLTVRSLRMEALDDSLRRFIAMDSVRIVRRGLAALGGRAVFFAEGDSMHLRSSPVVWYDRTQINGDSIDVYLRGRALFRVDVVGDAIAVSQSDSAYPGRFDQLRGGRLHMHFADKALNSIEVIERAISIYYVYDDSAGNGLNTASGDRIVLSFREGRVRTVRVFGGVEGQYVPENLVVGREAEFKIPGFVWRTDRPQMPLWSPGFVPAERNLQRSIDVHE
jgi:lipopolysaccharide export system protein LptA